MLREPGQVYLVGAGPGAVDLLTLRAARLIEAAEALLYDALVGPEILALAPRGCVRIQTGKRGDRPSMRQETINKLMLRLARRGLNVVRLKGGDPSIFGRVQEERDFLIQHGIRVDVVPGVTALCAAAAQFGFPVTHRELARRVTFTTGRLAGGTVQEQAANIRDAQTTLALYMAANVAQTTAQQLIAAGRSPNTPVLVAESVSLPGAKASHTTLAALADGEGIDVNGGPALLIVGDVVNFASHLSADTNTGVASHQSPPGAPAQSLGHRR